MGGPLSGRRRDDTFGRNSVPWARPNARIGHFFFMMKQSPNASPRAIALLLAAVALPATPLMAQDVAPLPTPAVAPTATVAPPPVVRTTPPTAAPTAVSVTPPPVVRTAPAAEATPVETARPAPRAASRVRSERVRRASPIVRPAPVAAAPVVAQAPVLEPAPPPPVEPVASAPAETVAPAEATNSAPIWPWLLGGLALLAALIGIVVSRRRRAVVEEDLYYDETNYEEPIAEPAFVDAAPMATAAAEAPVIEQIVVTEPAAEEIDAVVAGAGPVAERPWIELGMRPVRAGTQEHDAVVEFELTVANAGSVAAEDVRISTWMFTADPAQSENERLLIDPPADSTLTQMDLQPGDGRTVDAAIALPKAGLHRTQGAAGDSFIPVVGAEARYRLPDGSEGLISASFAIGVSQGEGQAMAPFAVDGAPDMQENVEARLYGVLERA